MFLDRIFRPFETAIRPFDLDIPVLPDSGPLQLVWHFAKHFRTVLALVVVLSVVSSLIGLAVIWMLAYVVDGVQSSGAAVFVSDNLTLLVAFALLLAVIDPVMTFIKDSYMQQSVQTLVPSAMRWRAHKAVEDQDVAFFEDLYAGQVASRIEQVTQSVQQQFLLAVQQVPQFLVQFAGSLGLMLLMAWQLAMPVLFWLCANVVLAAVLVPRLIRKSARMAGASSRATGAMTDVYGNIAIVKAFSAENAESKAIRSILQDTVDTQHREQREYVIASTIMQVLNALLAVGIFTVGMVGLMRGFVSMGDFVAAATITRTLFGSSYAFIGLGFSLSRSYGTIKDAMPVMTSRPSVVDKPDAQKLMVSDGRIVFDNISYAYNEPVDALDGDGDGETDSKENSTDAEVKHDESPVINNLNLTVAANEKVGLVGLSGAGKSTLVSLLLRLRDVDQGTISVDGHDVRDVTQTSLRAAMAVITQDAFLLNRSVRDNVKYGAPDATDDEVNHALQLAEAYQFVAALRDAEDRTGLDANVGDKGVKLSGGQRQRLAIARVILKDAKILLLDEATSALDSQVETEIQNNLMQLMQNRTALVIAHRLSTIATMDRLVVLDKGCIVEQGSHQELLNNKGLYEQLWRRQSGGFIASN